MRSLPPPGLDTQGTSCKLVLRYWQLACQCFIFSAYTLDALAASGTVIDRENELPHYAIIST
jgi:hypothetical protein